MRFSTPAGAYEIESVPSQPQMAHCHGFFVSTDHRGNGCAHDLKDNQNRMLAALGYDFATCTVCGSNTAQKRYWPGRDGKGSRRLSVARPTR